MSAIPGKTFLATIFILIVVDAAWLFTAGKMSLKMLEKIQGSPVTMRMWAAVIVYLALAYLVLQAKTVWQAAGIGVAAYAVYDYTSLATLKGFDWRMALADTAWGGILFAVTWSILKWIGMGV